jgi:hypothetical protein
VLMNAVELVVLPFYICACQFISGRTDKVHLELRKCNSYGVIHALVDFSYNQPACNLKDS